LNGSPKNWHGGLMRKVDKTEILANEYASWIAEYEKISRKHVGYSASHKYYKDVLVSLLWCQGGVCAYTEIFIANRERCGPDNFDEQGRYMERGKEESGFAAQLDHFDSTLKAAEGWKWDNFFAVSDKINVQKRNKSVDYILKPDTPEYDPHRFLGYDRDRHIFHANPDLEDECIIERVEEMIDLLGLNYGTIRDNRIRYLSLILKRLSLDLEEPVYQFFTAYQMCRE